MSDLENRNSNFIQNIIDEDSKTGKYGQKVLTRFPPEPNGYLHIGHAKSICLNFGIAERNSGKTNMRFDDTNPVKEEQEFVDSILEDIRWLGFDWEDRLFFASDYFDEYYNSAELLIEKGKAYVCELTPEQMREYRGSLTEPGKESPSRNRSVEENLDLFRRMKAGEFADGSRTLRAKIDMTSPNINMRDPVIYRIMRSTHHRTGDDWCIYPMYDYAHPIEDAIEGITHSICTLEFEDHRPLYDWVLAEIGKWNPAPQQIEFARLAVTNMVMSKRKLRALVEAGIMDGWDDPRMPTLSGLRRRGYTPAAIRDFCDRIGVAKANSTVDVEYLEHCVREDLNKTAKRAMVVIDPVKVKITNWPEGQIDWMESENYPDKPEDTRKIPFAGELYIEREDFMENPTGKFFRMAPDKEVRLKNGYIVLCTGVVKNSADEIEEIHCTYDPDSKTGGLTAGRKVKGVLHWVSAAHAIDVEVRHYDWIFIDKDQLPEGVEGQEVDGSILNPNSKVVISGAKAEPSLAESAGNYQFLRMGYYTKDEKLCTDGKLVFGRIVSLKDSFGKKQSK